MKINVEKAQECYVTAVGKPLKPICYVGTDNIADLYLDFVQNLNLRSRSTKLDLATIFNAKTNSQLMKLQNRFG